MLSQFYQTKSIQHFQVKNKQQVFVKAQQYPDFFNEQLVDPYRVIKVLKDDPNALERIFYYQYLNLCVKNAQGYPQIRLKNMRQILDSHEFTFTFLPNHNKKEHTDQQFKRIGRQFLDILKNSPKKLDQLLNQYPIVDQVFTLLMRSLLIINKQAEEIQQFIDKFVILQVLSRIFDIQHEIYGNCIRFNESDVFAYQQSSFQFYMAYIVNPQLSDFSHKCNHQNNYSMQRKQIDKRYGFTDYLNSESQKELFSNSSNSVSLSENYYPTQADKLYAKDFSKKILSKQFHNQQKKGNFNLQLKPIPEIAEIIFDNDERIRQKSSQTQKLFQNIDFEKNFLNYPQRPFMNQSQFSHKSSQSKLKYDHLSGSTFQITNNSKYSRQFNDILNQKQLLPLKNYNPQSYINGNFFHQKINSRENHKKSNTCPGSIPYHSSYLNVNVPNNNNFLPKYSQIFKERGFDFDIQKDINYTVKNPMVIESKFNMNKNKNDEDIDRAFQRPNIQLEVTKQFTNSFILRQMPQIYSQNIRRARDRARAYRKNLNQRN